MVEQIKKYLSVPEPQRDYDKGWILLSKVCKNRNLLHRLQRKPWPEKLYYELGKLAGRIDQAVLAKNAAKAAKTTKPEKETAPVKVSSGRIRVIKGENRVHYNDLPKELQQAWDENTLMYKEARSLHEKLKLLAKGTDEQRQPVLTRLQQLNQAIRSNWDKVDNYDPDKKPEVKKEPVVDHKRINSNRAYISRNLKKLENNPQKKDLRNRLQERITELVRAGSGFSDEQKARLKKLKLDLG